GARDEHTNPRPAATEGAARLASLARLDRTFNARAARRSTVARSGAPLRAGGRVRPVRGELAHGRSGYGRRRGLAFADARRLVPCPTADWPADMAGASLRELCRLRPCAPPRPLCRHRPRGREGAGRGGDRTRARP